MFLTFFIVASSIRGQLVSLERTRNLKTYAVVSKSSASNIQRKPYVVAARPIPITTNGQAVVGKSSRLRAAATHSADRRSFME
jgi:hypothetical protein